MRYQELDSSLKVVIDSDQQPTLFKRRRQINNERSVFTKEDTRKIFHDLVVHADAITENPTAVINSRKRHWKHELSGVSTSDFETIWMKARKLFFEHRGRNITIDGSKSSTSAGDNKSTEVARSNIINNYDGDDVVASDVEIPKNEIGRTTQENQSKQKSSKKSKIQDADERPPDRWSKLFIGQHFEMGYELTFEEFE